MLISPKHRVIKSTDLYQAISVLILTTQIYSFPNMYINDEYYYYVCSHNLYDNHQTHLKDVWFHYQRFDRILLCTGIIVSYFTIRTKKFIISNMIIIFKPWNYWPLRISVDQWQLPVSHFNLNLYAQFNIVTKKNWPVKY